MPNSSLTSHYEPLALRDGFNGSVLHIKSVLAIVDRIAEGHNFADIVSKMLDERRLNRDDIRPVVTMVLSQKYHYVGLSTNILTPAQDILAIYNEVKTWNAVDLVIVYTHPDLGPLVVNPKNKNQISQIDRLARYELAVVYAGRLAKTGNSLVLWKAAKALTEFLCGKKPGNLKQFKKGEFAYKEKN